MEGGRKGDEEEARNAGSVKKEETER